MVQKKDKELRGSNNGPIGGYCKWLKAHVQGLDGLPSLRTAKREEVEASEEDKEVQALRTELEQAQAAKERFKSAALKIRKENAELRDTNIATTKALEREPRGLIGKNTAGTSSEGLCGAVTVSLSFRERGKGPITSRQFDLER